MLVYTCPIFTRMRNIFYCLTSLSIICESKEQMECTKSHPYPCCHNQHLNDDNNTCIECPSGFFGWNCKSLCPSGFYGRLCKSPCECFASECHHVAGCKTTIECPSGFFGWSCKSLCPSGFYGRLCKSPCECFASECHHVTGCKTTIGTSSVKPKETLRTEPTVSNFMNTLSTNAKEKHTQVLAEVVDYKGTRF